MDNFIGSMDGVYRGRYRLRRDPKEYHRWLHEQFLVSIPRHSAQDCPIAFRARHKDRWLEWRVVDGVLMREVIDDNGKSMHPSRLARNTDGKSYDNALLTGFFRDHPESVFAFPMSQADRYLERSEPRAGIENATAGAVGSKRPAQSFWKWLQDERPEAEARVQAMAEKDMAVIDGTLFRRALEPMIQVGYSTLHRTQWISGVEMTLCIVEQMHTNFATATWFRADEMEAAELMLQAYTEAPADSAMFAPHALGGAFLNAELPRVASPDRPIIETTGAWKPCAEPHQAAVPLVGAFLPTSHGIATEQSTAMAINALHLSARHPVFGPSILPSDEAWSIFKRMAVGKDASHWHHAMVEADKAGEYCRGQVAASKVEELADFSI